MGCRQCTAPCECRVCFCDHIKQGVIPAKLLDLGMPLTTCERCRAASRLQTAHPLLVSVRSVALRPSRNRSPEPDSVALKLAPGMKPLFTATCQVARSTSAHCCEAHSHAHEEHGNRLQLHHHLMLAVQASTSVQSVCVSRELALFTWVVMGALDVTAFSAVAGRRTVSLMGCVVWKSCRVQVAYKRLECTSDYCCHASGTDRV